MFCCKFRSWNDAYTCSIFLNSTVWRGFWVLDGTGIWIAIWSFLLLQNLTSVLRKTADVTISDNSELDLLRWELTWHHVHFREVPSLTDTYEDTVPMKQDSCTGDYIRTAHRQTPIHPHTQVLCSSLWYRHTAPSPSLSLSLSLSFKSLVRFVLYSNEVSNFKHQCWTFSGLCVVLVVSYSLVS